MSTASQANGNVGFCGVLTSHSLVFKMGSFRSRHAMCELARGGKARLLCSPHGYYAAGSEDVDIHRHYPPPPFSVTSHFLKPKHNPSVKIDLQGALAGPGMDISQLANDSPVLDCLCIKLGCGYLEPIKGVGSKSAPTLIGSMDG
ncbi:Flap endonuclease 1 [Hypsizygus marmoreus]|uniref:Flap endonuclease 1 n=1 Tax=Hypsizygus marmoreus TaxID=39966 RepID=A0A369J7K1_HYPMA|nr:Flap endonuclease 1 [Hypsizygus marmoreus]